LKSLPGFFVGRIPRTGFAGCCGRPSGISLWLMLKVFIFHLFFSSAGIHSIKNYEQENVAL